MTSSREQFEEWFKSKYPQTADIHLNVTGGGSDFAKAIYSAWQASRQCIEVELPDCDKFEATWQYQKAAEERLSSEYGIKIKGA